MTASKPLFISFEGGEGSGKSTQVKLLSDSLRSQSKDVITTREPGGHDNAEAIRNLVLNGASDKWDAVSETLLFQAARIEHIKHVIAPALLDGKTVICDRFTDSTLVYQGICKGLGMSWVEQLFGLTMPRIAPDITILLDMNPAIGLARTQERNGNESRFESMGLAFHQQVRAGFLSLAKQSPARFLVIDAALPVENISRQINQHISSILKG